MLKHLNIQKLDHLHSKSGYFVYKHGKVVYHGVHQFEKREFGKARFMASSLSNLVNNLSERIHKIKCKYRHDEKKKKNSGIKYKYCDCFFEYINFKDNLIEHKYLFCNKNYQQKFDEKLKKQFLNTYKIFNQNNNKFILMFRKGVHPHEYMDDGEKFKET